MVDTLSEFTEAKPKDLMKKIGLETDEEYNVDVNTIL
jgi:hypothetical protein